MVKWRNTVDDYTGNGIVQVGAAETNGSHLTQSLLVGILCLLTHFADGSVRPWTRHKIP